jgi:7-cyano-7-deazaguanine synthase
METKTFDHKDLSLIPYREYQKMVLVSGGIDSTVLLHDICQQSPVRPLAIHFAGLSNPYEQAASEVLTSQLGVDLLVIDAESFMNACRPPRFLERSDGRAMLASSSVLMMAASIAEARKIPEVIVGLHKDDARAFIENSSEFLEYLNQGMRIIGAGCKIIAPYHFLRKADIIRKGVELNIDWNISLSCVTPINGRHDGTCVSCQARRAAFADSGILDPTTYADR